MTVGSSNDFDLVVLGAGTGGYTAAFRAAQLGLRVALVDEDKIDGPCLHRGRIRVTPLAEDGQDGDAGTTEAGSKGVRLLQATDVIIATGSRVKSLPGLEPDGERIVTSDDVLRRPDAPKSIVIVGAGAVGVE